MKYCAVDKSPCDGICQKAHIDAVGNVCCSECFSVEEILSRSEMKRRGMIADKARNRRRRDDNDESEE